MEPTDSTADRLTESGSKNKEETRSPLGIDLNEIPAASGFCGGACDSETETETVDVVRAIHDNPDPAPGAPAELPEPDRAAACAACRAPEAREPVVVCDGCERGFHLGCIEAGLATAVTADWICEDCVNSGVRSKRWPLGVKSRLILDINASPPSDVEGDGCEEVVDLREPMAGDSSFGGAFGNAFTYSNILYPSGRYGWLKGAAHNVKMGLENAFSSPAVENFQDIGQGFPFGSFRSDTGMPVRLPSWNPSEMFLQALGDFVSERHGVLEEGWRVELKHSLDGHGWYAVYCAPDGKTFGSMQEVACYMGLKVNGSFSSTAAEVRPGGSAPQRRLDLSKKRKATRLPINGFPDRKRNSASGQHRGVAFGKTMNTGLVLEETNGGLPVQFEDFFVLSLGLVDTRPLYHDVSLIFPIGYKSCWHDRKTGSLFTCEVLDGGVSGPKFNIRRSPCSELSVPDGSTVIRTKTEMTSKGNSEKSDVRDANWDSENDFNFEILLSDPYVHEANDLLTCLSSSYQVQTVDSSQKETGSGPEKFNSSLSNVLEFKDEIGHIVAEENSVFAAWQRMTQKLIDACSEILKEKGTLKFFCKHVDKGTCSSNWDMMDEQNKATYSSLSKFCSSWAPLVIPSEYRLQSELGTLADVLSTWLDQDRFGLEADFVQEMIEHLPGVESCSRYKFIKERNSHSASLTLGSGLLLANTKGGEYLNKDLLCGFTQKAKKPRLNNDCPPPGKPLCFRLPPVLIGDFLQVSDVFWRFHEILGLEKPFPLTKIEEELINPCSVGFEDFTENSLAIAQMQTETRKDAPEIMVSSVSHSRCFGLSLTRAHISLLQVLICELHSKVAAFVDPNFDSGESRSRRGRRKETDLSLPAKRTKLHMLPINELTWPELARRYILAVLSMDGNLESAETAARESGKVFRCLQGDGGLLCGSLAGVDGMEGDAILLADATKRIFGSSKRENIVLTLEEDDPDGPAAVENNASNGDIPEWAQMLEPVKKLPTNVGTRIRKCVYDALEKNPPDWARKILEHSISKEVYKGNASGPTKKAVLSLLVDVRGQEAVQKVEKIIKKTTSVGVDDIIMKQCRIVLRRVIAADDDKIFCNLLGRKIHMCSDNDDEGLLGTPAMVSRPLDFRTIDLRLAAGAYGGSHEAFLEDVRELWSTIHSVYTDQIDCVELAEALSQKFESLYEEEVLSLVKKLADYTRSGSLSTEMKKEIDSIITSTSELPKAPWDEGVCKVCGIDKDDDSVLLCDSCDAEYHTYCLNPPLIRIPEGNWYCPSCITGKRMGQDVSESYKLISRQKRRKCQGEITRVYLESIMHLAVSMEEKEYWEFSIEQRILLLKLLCDELLSSAHVHQHLEQCAEAISELQQKLRVLLAEQKNLKSREEFLSGKVSKLDASMLNESGEIRDGQPQISSRGKGFTSNDPQLEEDGEERVDLNNASDKLSAILSNKIHTQKVQCDTPFENDGQLKDVHASSGCNFQSHESDNLSSQTCKRDDLQKSTGTDQNEPSLASDSVDTQTAHCVPSLANEAQACLLELNTTKSNILQLEESIRSLESLVLKQSVRREYLGSDSGGRLYWISSMFGGHPRIIVDVSASQQKTALLSKKSDLVGSEVPSPFLHGSNHTRLTGSPWAYYASDTEIQELVHWLSDNDPKERELRESILSWKRLRFWDSQTTKSDVQNVQAPDVSPIYPVTKARIFLEKKYGTCYELEIETVKEKVMDLEKMYRCRCLEPILPSMSHCLKCHKTFSRESEFDDHNDGSCIQTPMANEETKTAFDASKGMVSLKSEYPNSISNAGKTPIETFNSPELSSGLIRFQNEDLRSPYQFDEICSKFVTKDSNKDLVEEVGLIGSNGVPSFIPSPSPLLSDSLLLLLESKRQEDEASGDEVRYSEQPVVSRGNKHGNASEINEPSKRSSPNDAGAISKSNLGLGLSESKKRKSSGFHSIAMGIGDCCVVPQTSLRPLAGKASTVAKQLRINLLDMEAALPEAAFRQSKGDAEQRWAWRAFVKSAERIYELVQATIVMVDMIKSEYLRNEWWYWSSLSAAARISTISALALRIFSLDDAIIYDKSPSQSDLIVNPKLSISVSDQKPSSVSDTPEKIVRTTRKSSKKKKEPEG